MVDTDNTQQMMDYRRLRRTKPGVLHKLPTGELKSNNLIQNIQKEKMDEKTILGNIGLLQLVTKQT